MQSAGECPQTLHGQDILHSRSPTTVGRCCVTPHITLGRPRSSLTDLHLIPPCAASAWTWCSRECAATPYVPMCGRGQCPMKGFQNSFFFRQWHRLCWTWTACHTGVSSISMSHSVSLSLPEKTGEISHIIHNSLDPQHSQATVVSQPGTS